VLTKCEVDYIVVGGVAAVLNGVPLMTFDLDLVHSRAQPNISRLLVALEELDGIYRLQPEKRLRPNESHLASLGHQLLVTRFGPLDLLGMIGLHHTYDDLADHSLELAIEQGLSVRVLNLDTLISVKEETAGEKDRAALPLLRRTLQERDREPG
jgi:hypothetical protein